MLIVYKQDEIELKVANTDNYGNVIILIPNINEYIVLDHVKRRVICKTIDLDANRIIINLSIIGEKI